MDRRHKREEGRGGLHSQQASSLSGYRRCLRDGARRRPSEKVQWHLTYCVYRSSLNRVVLTSSGRSTEKTQWKENREGSFCGAGAGKVQGLLWTFAGNFQVQKWCPASAQGAGQHRLASWEPLPPSSGPKLLLSGGWGLAGPRAVVRCRFSRQMGTAGFIKLAINK